MGKNELTFLRFAAVGGAFGYCLGLNIDRWIGRNTRAGVILSVVLLLLVTALLLWTWREHRRLQKQWKELEAKFPRLRLEDVDAAKQEAAAARLSMLNTLSHEPSITCPVCDMTSYNINDVKNGWCGNCHRQTSPAAARYVQAAAEREGKN